MSFFTTENGYFDDEQLTFTKRGGRTSNIDWDGMIESGKWYFIPNSQRTEKAIKNNGTPKPPSQIDREGYKFSMRKAQNPVTEEWGLAIKCVVYPDNM